MLPLSKEAKSVLAELRECMMAENVEPENSPWKPLAWWANEEGISQKQAERMMKLGVKLGRIERKSGYLMFECGRRRVPLYRVKDSAGSKVKIK